MGKTLHMQINLILTMALRLVVIVFLFHRRNLRYREVNSFVQLPQLLNGEPAWALQLALGCVSNQYVNCLWISLPKLQNSLGYRGRCDWIPRNSLRFLFGSKYPFFPLRSSEWKLTIALIPRGFLLLLYPSQNCW